VSNIQLFRHGKLILSRQRAVPLHPQAQQNKLLTDPEGETLGTANYAKALASALPDDSAQRACL
jgi:hypothetical protein